MQENIPFSFLKIARARWPLHIVAAALGHPNTAGSPSSTPPNRGGFDGVMTITCALLLDESTVLSKEPFESGFLHEIGKSPVESRVGGNRRDILPSQPKVGIDGDV